MYKHLCTMLLSSLFLMSANASEFLPDMSGEWIIQSTTYANGVTKTDTSEPTTMDNGLDYYLPNFKCNGHNQCEAGQNGHELAGRISGKTILMEGGYYDPYVNGLVTQRLLVSWGKFEGKDFVTIHIEEYSDETGELTAIGTDTFHRP